MQELTVPIKSYSGINSPGIESNGNFLIQFSDTLDPFFVRKLPTWKHTMDIIGSIVGLILFSPIFLLISSIIKMVSPGPVFFRQDRIGYGGEKFSFLKFRTMKANPDTSVHQQYYCNLIKGNDDHCSAMAKLDDNDPQIIPFGKLLRKTYLDELPQFINVLFGEMSLVGPRPPIPYEVAEYIKWHNGRFDAMPGMTGLWQVSGKNKLSFQEMVRLDISYSRNLSFLRDLKILLRTPVAILLELIESLRNKIIHKLNGLGFNVPG
jgi:lipopolysaccharide/colanic/teichoic acid biosynthesis glycosyltransferase